MRRILSFLMVSCILMSAKTGIFAPNLRAVGTNKTTSAHVVSGERVLSAEENARYYASLSEKDLRMMAEKDKAIVPSKRVLAKAATKISVPGTFVMYQQEEDNYCIPATIQSILMYLTGDSPEQDEIYRATERDPTQIPAFLNRRQTKCYYVYSAVSTFDKRTMCTRIYNAIVNQKAPASMGIAGTTKRDWFYTTSGHCLVVNAIYDDYSKIQFGDPLGERVAGTPYYYEKNADVVYTYCKRIVY